MMWNIDSFMSGAEDISYQITAIQHRGPTPRMTLQMLNDMTKRAWGWVFSMGCNMDIEFFTTCFNCFRRWGQWQNWEPGGSRTRVTWCWVSLPGSGTQLVASRSLALSPLGVKGGDPGKSGGVREAISLSPHWHLVHGGGKFWLSALIGRARVGGRVNISLLFSRPLSHSPPKGEGSMLGQNWVLFGHIHSMTMSLTACLCPPKIYMLKPSSSYSRI